MTDEEIEEAFEDAKRPNEGQRFWDMLLYLGNEDLPLAKRTKWEPQMRELLEHESPVIVGEAIEMLASRWELVGFKDECLSFADHPDEEVRVRAVAGLSSLGPKCGDYGLAVFLKSVLDDEERSVAERGWAAFAIPRVLEGGFQSDLLAAIMQLPRSGVSSEAFNGLVPWEALDNMLCRHRPEGWLAP